MNLILIHYLRIELKFLFVPLDPEYRGVFKGFSTVMMVSIAFDNVDLTRIIPISPDDALHTVSHLCPDERFGFRGTVRQDTVRDTSKKHETSLVRSHGRETHRARQTSRLREARQTSMPSTSLSFFCPNASSPVLFPRQVAHDMSVALYCPRGNPGANGWFLQSTPIQMPPLRGGIYGRLT